MSYRDIFYVEQATSAACIGMSYAVQMRCTLTHVPLQDGASVVAPEQIATVDPRVVGYGAFGATIFTMCSAYAGWFGMTSTEMATVVPVAVPHNLPLTIMLLAFAWALVFNAISSFVGGRGILLGISAYGALVSAIFAFYLSAAVILNSTAQRQILPIHSSMRTSRTNPPAMRRNLRSADRAVPGAGQ